MFLLVARFLYNGGINYYCLVRRLPLPLIIFAATKDTVLSSSLPPTHMDNICGGKTSFDISFFHFFERQIHHVHVSSISPNFVNQYFELIHFKYDIMKNNNFNFHFLYVILLAVYFIRSSNYWYTYIFVLRLPLLSCFQLIFFYSNSQNCFRRGLPPCLQ